MTIDKLEKKIYPLEEIAKINEIIDDMNLTGVFATTNSSALVPSSGVCSWTVTHNLNTTNVICLLLINGAEISKNVAINNANSVIISFNSAETKAIGDCKVVVMTRGGSTGSDSGTVYNSTISIVQGDVPKGSFTLNQSQDQTIDLVAGGSYNLPTASTSQLGGVKIDNKTVKINDEVISAGVYPKHYLVSGVIVNAQTNTTVSGFGSANVTLYGSGLVEIRFTFKLTAKNSTVDWIWGLNRDLIRSLSNNKIPVITPLNHMGSILFYNGSLLSDSWNGYGGVMETDGGGAQYWIPARLYTTSGNIGRYSASSLNADTRIEGTAYGTYTVGTEG